MLSDVDEQRVISLSENENKQLNDIAVAVARIEAGMAEYRHDMENVHRRLDRHSERLDSLEKVQNQAIGIKSFVVWMVGTILTAVGVAVSVANRIMGGG